MFYDPFWLRAHYGFGRPFLQSFFVFENCKVPWKLTAKTQVKLQRQIESDSEFKRQTEREDVVDRDGNRIDLGGLF